MKDPVLDAWRAGDDEAFIRELSLNSIEQAFRPRDRWDVGVHPESLRGKVLAMYDACDAFPWWLRAMARIWARLHR